MTDLEPLVRKHFSDAAGAVAGADLLGGVSRRRAVRQRTRVRVAAGMVAGAVVATAVIVPVEIATHRSPTRQTLAVAVAPSVPPPGTRAVTWAGIEIDVPASWATDDTRCGVPVAPTVIYDGATPACAYTGSRAVSTLTVASDDLTTALDTTVPLPTVAFAGLPAKRGTVTSGNGPTAGLTTTYVWVPSRHVSFAVSGPTAAGVDAILATAHTVPGLDGCPSARPGDAPAVTGTGRGQQRVGAPYSAAVCSYHDGWLLGGTTVKGAALDQLVSAIEAAPASYTPSELEAQRADGIDAGPCGTRQDWIVRFAPGMTLTIATEGCGGQSPGIAGSVQSTVTARVYLRLVMALPYASGPSAGEDAIPAG